MNNILTGAGYGLLPGWTASLAVSAIGSTVLGDEAFSSIMVAGFFGWFPGLIGGSIGGLLSKDNTSSKKNGIICGTAVGVLLSSALLNEINRISSGSVESPPSTTPSF